MNDLVKEIADKLQLPESLVERVIRSQFEFVKECMEHQENVHLHYLGKFAVKPGRLYKLNDEGKGRRKDDRRLDI